MLTTFTVFTQQNIIRTW